MPVVVVSQELLEKLKVQKARTGISLVRQVSRAVENDLRAQGAIA